VSPDKRINDLDPETTYEEFTLYLRDESGNVMTEFTYPACPAETTPLSAQQAFWDWRRDHAYFSGKQIATVKFDPKYEMGAGECEPNNSAYDIFLHHKDHLGTLRVVTKWSDGLPGSGNEFELFKSFHAYWPYGEEITNQTQDDLTHRYTGHERDFESNLDYMHARYYSQFQGRFLVPDTVRGNPEMPQTWNLYSYVRNNPMFFTDPDGRTWRRVQGGWVWRQGSMEASRISKKEKPKKEEYTYMLKVEITGTNDLGATTYKLTLYNENKVVAQGTAFSGGGGFSPIPSGTYYIKTAIRNEPPSRINPDSPLMNPFQDYGMQQINREPLLNERTGEYYDVFSAYGPIRARLNPEEGATDPGLYYHGQTPVEGITHGCLCYGEDKQIINNIWNNIQGPIIPVAVNVPVEEPQQ